MDRYQWFISVSYSLFIIYLYSPILGKVTATASTVNNCEAVTVPPPMKDRPPTY